MSHTLTRILAAVAALVLIGSVIVLSSKSDVAELPAPQEASSEAASSTSSAPESGESEPAPLPVYAAASSSTTVAVATKAVVAPATATLVVEGVRYDLHAAPGSMLEEAFALLKTEGGFDYRTESYRGLGAFVTEINGRAGGNGHYWILFVNGKKSATGISSTRIRSGDLIEWKLEKSY